MVGLSSQQLLLIRIFGQVEIYTRHRMFRFIVNVKRISNVQYNPIRIIIIRPADYF